jgi:hypothetical protein
MTQPEDAFRRSVQEYAQLRGWMFWHQRPARTNEGWRSAGEGDKGFPDVVFARNGDKSSQIVIVEFKSETGRLSKDQRAWLEALGLPMPHDRGEWVAAGRYVGVWRPADWPHIEDVLR